MAALMRSITGQLPDERGYKAVRVERVPGDHEMPTFWAVIGFDEIWNNAPNVRWEYHARDEAEAEDVADWLRGIGR